MIRIGRRSIILLFFSIVALTFLAASRTAAVAHSSSPPMRVLVVGAGSISREYATHHFLPHTTDSMVVGVVDLDLEKAAALAADIAHEPPYFASLQEALQNDDHLKIDMVYIGTTPKTHRVLVEQALQHNKHVLLEKPIAADSQDADAIVAATDRADSNLIVAMNIGMRYNGALHELRRLVLDDNQYADDETLHAELKLHFQQWPREWQVQPWCAGRVEGGPLREVGTHFFFALLEFVGAHDVMDSASCSARTPVTARVRANIDYPKHDDDDEERAPCETAASGTIEFKGGSLPTGGMTVDLSVRTDAPSDLYELTVRSENDASRALTLFDFCSLRNEKGDILVQNASYGRWECIDAVVGRTRGTTTEELPSIVTPRQGRNAQRLLDAILDSNGSFRDVVFD